MNLTRSLSSASRRGFSVLAALLLGAVFAAPATLHATAYTVNVLTDTKPTLGGAGSGTTGDLRYCITQANYGAAGSTHSITFTVTGTITLAAYELVINSDLTISGPGSASLTISGNNATRILLITPGHTVSISRLTLTKGNGAANDATGLDPGNSVDQRNGGGAIFNDRSVLTVSACTISASSGGSGGGIYNYARGADARLTVANCLITGNSASDYNGGGGGIYNWAFGGTATLNLSNSVISDNTTDGEGGGINNHGLATSANATITNCTISGNSADGFDGGGGISSTGQEDGEFSSTVTITDSLISGNFLTGNSRAGGGGILNGSGDGMTSIMTLRNCTVSGNTSNTVGGGLSNYSWLGTGTVTIDQCTISGNTAATSGGGVFNYGLQGVGTVNVHNSTVSGNAATQRGGGIHNFTDWNDGTTFALVNITNSTISGNSALTGGGGIANQKTQGYTSTARVTLSNTILALHPTGANYNTAYGLGVSNGFNLSDDASASAFLTNTGDRNSTPAGLQADANGLPVLQNNGGPAKTIALMAGSKAIDAGKAANDPVTGWPAAVDQRGYFRPFDTAGVASAAGGDGSDIGAFEAGSGPFIALSPNPVAGGSTSGGGVKAVGASVTAKATPNAGYLFVNWTEAGKSVSTSASYTFTAGAARILVANFKLKSSNANLSGLALSAGTLSPAFASGTIGYTATVSNATSSLTITPTVADGTAKVKINGVTVDSGTPSAALPLAVGLNTFTTLVTAQNGTTKKTYTVGVTRVGAPAATTLAATEVVFNGATLNSTATPNGLTTTAHFEYGPTTAYGRSTANQNAGAGTTAVALLAALSDLTASTIYHYRAVAANSSGTVYGADQTFTTPGDAVVGTFTEKTLSRNFPTVAGRVVDVGAFTFSDNTGGMEIVANVTGGGMTVAKYYVIPIRYNLTGISSANTWLKVLPANDTGASSGKDFDLELKVSQATASLRVRATSAGSGTPVAKLVVKSTGLKTFVASSATTAVSAPTLAFAGNAVTQLAGKAGIEVTPASAAALDIFGGNTEGLRLRPRTQPGAPASGTWNPGTVILDSTGTLYICTASGTPGTWKKVGN